MIPCSLIEATLFHEPGKLCQEIQRQFARNYDGIRQPSVCLNDHLCHIFKRELSLRTRAPGSVTSTAGLGSTSVITGLTTVDDVLISDTRMSDFKFLGIFQVSLLDCRPLDIR